MHVFVTRALVAVSAAAVATTLAAMPASAARDKPGLGKFFEGGNGSAGWSTDVTSPSGAPTIRLDVPDDQSSAGVSLKQVGSSLPEQAPSFEFQEVGAASGGAPRLVIRSTDGCIATEYALIDGTASYAPGWHTAGQWDLMGSCGYAYSASYETVAAAFAGRVVDSVYVVSDSYGAGHTDYVANIQYDGVVMTAPPGNRAK